MGAIGVTLASVPFIGSLAPSREARATRPGVDLSKLAPGTFVEKENARSRLFVLKDDSGLVYIFAVPFIRKKYWLPDIRWAPWGIPCESFGPDNENGILTVEGTFHCRDSVYGDYYERELHWAFDGSSLGVRTENMPVPKHEVDGDWLYLE